MKKHLEYLHNMMVLYFTVNDYKATKKTKKSIAVYEKNGHMMIALQSIPRFRGTPEFLETVWDNQTSTATLKFRGRNIKRCFIYKWQ